MRLDAYIIAFIKFHSYSFEKVIQRKVSFVYLNDFIYYHNLYERLITNEFKYIYQKQRIML